MAGLDLRNLLVKFKVRQVLQLRVCGWVTERLKLLIVRRLYSVSTFHTTLGLMPEVGDHVEVAWMAMPVRWVGIVDLGFWNVDGVVQPDWHTVGPDIFVYDFAGTLGWAITIYSVLTQTAFWTGYRSPPRGNGELKGHLLAAFSAMRIFANVLIQNNMFNRIERQ